MSVLQSEFACGLRTGVSMTCHTDRIFGNDTDSNFPTAAWRLAPFPKALAHRRQLGLLAVAARCSPQLKATAAP
jgi:hypothetical protein